MLFLSPKRFLAACAAVATFGASPDARAASILLDAPDFPVLVGQPTQVLLWFDVHAGPGTSYLASFDASLDYDASLLRPQRVTFTSNLGSPDVRSWVFDAASAWFVPAEFGAGDAWSYVARFPSPPISAGDFFFGETSLIPFELQEPPRFLVASLTFDSLQPGTSPMVLRYTMNDSPHVSTTFDSINIVPVPEPSTFFMMLAAAPWLVSRLRQHAQRPR